MKVKKEKREKQVKQEEAEEVAEEVAEEASEPERTYEEMLGNLNPIANPLAGRKLTRRLYKCIKKAAKEKNVRRGVKEVQKFLNKGEKGIVVLAGDVFPVEVYCHIPAMCEERSIPYAYVPCKADLGAAVGSKRPTCVTLVKYKETYEDSYNDCFEEVKGLPLPY